MKFKDDVIAARYEDLHPKLQEILNFLDSFLQRQYGFDMTITSTTSTKEEDDVLGRQSDTHRTRRAVDIRTIGVPSNILEDILSFLNVGYGDLGAVNGNGEANIVVNKSKTSQPHLHVQLNREYALKELNYGKESNS